MAYASTDVLAMLVVGQRGGAVAHGMEPVLLIGTVVHVVLQLIEVILFTICQQLDDGYFVLEVVEDDIVLVENVEEVGRIVRCARNNARH